MESVKDLVGLTFEKVTLNSAHGDDVITFTHKDGYSYQLYHDQSCCESVNIEKITGKLSDLAGFPILEASEEFPELSGLNEDDDSYTWTLYKFRTEKGSVEILWYGVSNGYYSENVNFCKVS